MNYDEDAPFEVARYREMQKALPGADALYDLMRAHIENALPNGGQVLVVGAGGGREVEALLASDQSLSVTGVDPSADMLTIASWYVEQSGRADQVDLHQGTINDLAPSKVDFDAATSLLVMHFLPDDDSPGGKSAYLSSIRERMKPGARLLHADVSFESEAEFEILAPVFMRHALIAGLPQDTIKVAPDTIAELPIISPSRTEALLAETGFANPRTFFQSLWYRAWIAEAG